MALSQGRAEHLSNTHKCRSVPKQPSHAPTQGSLSTPPNRRHQNAPVWPNTSKADRPRRREEWHSPARQNGRRNNPTGKPCKRTDTQNNSAAGQGRPHGSLSAGIAPPSSRRIGRTPSPARCWRVSAHVCAALIGCACTVGGCMQGRLGGCDEW